MYIKLNIMEKKRTFMLINLLFTIKKPAKQALFELFKLMQFQQLRSDDQIDLSLQILLRHQQ